MHVKLGLCENGYCDLSAWKSSTNRNKTKQKTMLSGTGAWAAAGRHLSFCDYIELFCDYVH